MGPMGKPHQPQAEVHDEVSRMFRSPVQVTQGSRYSLIFWLKDLMGVSEKSFLQGSYYLGYYIGVLIVHA